MASGGEEAFSLAAHIARFAFFDIITGTATAVIASADTVEQFRQFDARKVKQVTAGTTRDIATIAARIAWITVAGITGIAVADDIARTAIGRTAAEFVIEQTSK